MLNRCQSILKTFALLAVLFTIAVPTMAEEGVVNVNTAGVEELSLLPKVGPSVAARIVEFREQNGAFKKAEELMLVKGIGEKTFSHLEPYVSVQGETTLEEKVRISRDSSR